MGRPWRRAPSLAVTTLSCSHEEICDSDAFLGVLRESRGGRPMSDYHSLGRVYGSSLYQPQGAGTVVDGCGRWWTVVGGCGRLWTVVDGSLARFIRIQNETQQDVAKDILTASPNQGRAQGSQPLGADTVFPSPPPEMWENPRETLEDWAGLSSNFQV